jgi:hypothetical protein
MKVYFQDRAAKFKLHNVVPTCKSCLFYMGVPCPFGASTIVDCGGKGHWIDGESLDIFKV